MANRNFRQMLEQRWSNGCFVCVGLDTDRMKISDAVERYLVGDAMGQQGDLILAFNRHIIDATHEFVCAYKPNSAFYERFGADGMEALRNTIAYIHKHAPDVPVILDAKRADIGNTNAGYVHAAFEGCQADAVTVNPYLGQEALKPFLDQSDKGVIILCKTSNPGGGEFQDQPYCLNRQQLTELCDNDPSLEDNLIEECVLGVKDLYAVPAYRYVAIRVAKHWNKNGNCLLVVGATYPEQLAQIRRNVGDMPILIPGIGSQGGDVEKTVKAGKDANDHGMIINSSRGIIFASQEKDFATAARAKTEELNELIKTYL